MTYDDWTFRKIEGKSWTFAANEQQKTLPKELHHLTSLYQLDQTDPIEWCSNEKWEELNRFASFAGSSPKLRAVKLVKDETQGGNVMKLLFGPPAAGGEKVYYGYVETPSVTSLDNVPAFLHEAVALKVIAEVSQTIVGSDATKAVITENYERNVRRYEAKIKELWLQFNRIPIQPLKIEMDNSTIAFHKAGRRIVPI